MSGLVGEPSDWISPSSETWWLDHAIVKHSRKRSAGAAFTEPYAPSSRRVLLSTRDWLTFARTPLSCARAGIAPSIPILFLPPVRRSTPTVASLAPLPSIPLCARPSRVLTRSASASRSVTPIRLQRWPPPPPPAATAGEEPGNNKEEETSLPRLRMTATETTRATLLAAFGRGMRIRARAIRPW